LSDWTTQFSLPCEPAGEAVFDTIVTAHGMAVASLLLDQYGEDIGRASSDLVEFIRGWAGAPSFSQSAWDISFGRASLALKNGKVDAVDAAIRVGLRIISSGRAGRWRAQLPVTSIQLDDAVVEGVTQVEVDSESTGECTIGLLLADGRYVNVYRDEKGGSWIAPGVERLESVGRNSPIYLLPRHALPADERGSEVFRECRPVEVITAEMTRSFAAAVAVLEQNTSQYIPWVERVLHGIVVCPQQTEFRLVSGSWEDAPGLVHMSSRHRGIDIAEILVHECAHQYFYMLQRVGPLDDSTDAELYSSPPIRKMGPLSRILMGYHALANVQLFYNAVRTNNANDPLDIEYVRINEPDLQAAISALDVPLRDNPALTALGRGLYAPLAERMAAFAM